MIRAVQVRARKALLIQISGLLAEMSSMDADGVSATSCAQTTKCPDEWHHIADSTQRKKVQNRNAQRIYRK
jgi:hypothetical protein